MAVKIPRHLKKRFAVLERQPISKNLPPPWKELNTVSVGGLTDVGFADNSDLLLCLSHDGRGLIDCIAGTKIARDYSNDFEFDTGNLLVAGIGSVSNRNIRTAGIHGGGLAASTNDGWSVERHPFAFPDEEVFICSPGQSMISASSSKKTEVTKLGGFVTGLRAYGFSPTGNSFVIATSSDVYLYTRS